MYYKIYIINGPNINLTEIRSKLHYGEHTYEQIRDMWCEYCDEKGIELEHFQSNWEGGIIDEIHRIYQTNQLEDNKIGIIINAGAFSHTSYAIRDAIEAVDIPCIEVHLSNVHSREKFRLNSVIAPVCIGQISGFKAYSYIMAIDAFMNYWK